MKPAAVALLGAVVWLAWNVEHDHTSIRAPWTGATLGASACAFIAVGVIGRGWRAILASLVIAAAVTLLVAVGLWDALESDPLHTPSPDIPESCDPGCIPLAFFVIFTAAEATALTALGIVGRRSALAVRAWGRGGRGRFPRATTRRHQ